PASDTRWPGYTVAAMILRAGKQVERKAAVSAAATTTATVMLRKREALIGHRFRYNRSLQTSAMKTSKTRYARGICQGGYRSMRNPATAAPSKAPLASWSAGLFEQRM